MPELLTLQDLANGHLDVKALGEAANGDENTIVTTRTGNTYPSAERAINIMFQNGGLPATPFATKALMTASALVDGKYAMVTEDTVNNGLYVKTAGAWAKSTYDPLTQAKAYTDTNKADTLSKVQNAFDTKALMAASPLPDGSKALVDMDTEANNGLYVKTAGAWLKSAYNPLTTSKSYTDDMLVSVNHMNKQDSFLEGISEGLSEKEPIPLVKKDAGYITIEGVFTPHNSVSTTDFLPVSKDDCYLLVGSKNSSLGFISAINFYSSTKEHIGVLSMERRDNMNANSSKSLLESNSIGIHRNLASKDVLSCVVPSNGFIKVTWATSYVTTQPDLDGIDTQLFKVDFNTLIEASLINVPSKAFKNYQGIVQSAVIDPAYPNANLGGIALSSTVGSPIGFQTLTNLQGSFVSKKVSVKENDYLHLYTAVDVTTTTDRLFVWLEDANGNYLEGLGQRTEYSIPMSNTGFFINNLRIRQDGFVRFMIGSKTQTPAMIGVSKEKIDVPKNYLKDGDKLLNYTGLGGLTYLLSAFSPFRTAADLATLKRGNLENVSNLTTMSIPYRLRKGEVLEYSVEATVLPILAYALKADEAVYGIGAFIGSSLMLYAPEVMQKGTLINYNEGTFKNGDKFYEDARKGTIAYCDEDSDSIIIFLVPSKGHETYTRYKQDASNSVRIYSKAEYIKKRDKELADRFKIISALNIVSSGLDTSATNKVGSFPPVLLFKGEVLQYASGSAGYATASGGVWNSPIDSTIALGSLFTLNRYNLPNPPVFDLNKGYFNFKNQIYAHKTGLVYAGVRLFKGDTFDDYDEFGQIASAEFPARIININDLELGTNIEVTEYVGSGIYTHPTIYNTAPDAGADVLAGNNVSNMSFVRKGSYIEGSGWINNIGDTMVIIPIANILKLDDYSGQFIQRVSTKRIAGVNDKGNRQVNEGTTPSLFKEATYIEEDSIVFVSSDVGGFNPPLAEAGWDGKPVSDPLYDLDLIRMASFELTLREVTQSYYENFYKVTNETRINIPITTGIRFNFCTPTAQQNSNWNKLQIIKDGQVVVVLNVKTQNQGQSTALNRKKNINVDFYNADYKKVYIKWGESLAQESLVLKAYQSTDNIHVRDTLSTDLWHDVRTVNPYPESTLMPIELFEDRSIPSNQSAKFCTTGFPVEVFKGGAFWSISSVRTKKKDANYAMDDSKLNHILMQAEWTLNGVIIWTRPNINNFEIRSPKMSGYEDGDAVLPVGFESVQANIERIVEWFRKVYSNQVVFKDTYKDYINLESFVDYALMMFLTWHWDGAMNNFLMGTHNGSIWDVYWYDSDQSWGIRGSSPVLSPYTLDSGNIFHKITTLMPEYTKHRYAVLRDSGLINIHNIQERMRGLDGFIHSGSKIIDSSFWTPYADMNGLHQALRFADERIKYLDLHYGYTKELASEYLYYSKFGFTTIAANSTEIREFSVASAVPSKNYTARFGGDLLGLTYTVECLVEGTITVTFTNNTSEPLKPVSSYILIREELI